MMMPRYAPLLWLLLAASAAAQPIPDTLRAPADADSITVFGWAVDADADRVLVGARVWPPPYPRSQNLGADATQRADHHGTVFVYRRSATGEWEVEGRLKADYISNEDCFGWSMDLRGDLAAVGAECEYGQTTKGWYDGAVYLYRYDGAAWVREAKLVFPFAEDEVFSIYGFGASVSLGDGYFVAGSRTSRNPANPEEDYASGAAYVFEREGDTWSLAATLINDDADEQINETFGATVAVAGNEVLVGSPGSDASEIDRSGAVYVFERTGDEWVQTTRLTAPEPTEMEYFGVLLAADDGGAVASSGTAIYPLERGAGGWSAEPELSVNIRPNGVARAADYLLTVDISIADGGYDGYLFEKQDAGWAEARLPMEPYTASRDEMVSLSGQQAFVGVPTFDGGQVLVYDLGQFVAGEPEAAIPPPLTLSIAPNPAVRDATIRFELPQAGAVRVTAYDVLGREVARIGEGARPAGAQAVGFDAGGLAPGVYVLRLQTEGRAVTHRFTVVR